MRQRISRLAAYAWASPWSVVGLAFGLLVLALGGKAGRRQGVLEFTGGRLGRWLSRLPCCGFGAITWGHVLLALDRRTLDAVRLHEHVHVRQYERWGLFFVPAYLLSSLFQWLRGRRPYQDNWFECEAFAAERARSRNPR